MVVFVTSCGRSLASVIVPCTVNLIVDWPVVAAARRIVDEFCACCVFAACMADRKEPAPESLRVLTVVEEAVVVGVVGVLAVLGVALRSLPSAPSAAGDQRGGGK